MNGLTVTNQADVIGMIQASNLADSSKVKYSRAVQRYLKTGNSLTDSEALKKHAEHLSASGRGFLKAALKLWADNVAIEAKGQAEPGNVAAIQATLYRLESLTEAVKVKPQKGLKAHTWLSQAEVRGLLNTCDTSRIEGLRDKLAIALLAAAGLRREEAVNLKWADITILPIEGKPRTVLNIKGKGDTVRPIPISEALAKLLDRWAAVTGREGLILRSLGMKRELGSGMSAVALFHLVRKAGEKIGKPKLAPHDLRRSYARLGYDAGVDIGQISLLLGHKNVKTTQRYLGLEIDHKQTISDFIPLE